MKSLTVISGVPASGKTHLALQISQAMTAAGEEHHVLDGIELMSPASLLFEVKKLTCSVLITSIEEIDPAFLFPLFDRVNEITIKKRK